MQVKAEVRGLNLTRCWQFYSVDTQVLYLVFSLTRSDWWLCGGKSAMKQKYPCCWLGWRKHDFYCDIYKTGPCDPPTQWNYLQSSLSHSRPVWIIMCSLLHRKAQGENCEQQIPFRMSKMLLCSLRLWFCFHKFSFLFFKFMNLNRCIDFRDYNTFLSSNVSDK